MEELGGQSHLLQSNHTSYFICLFFLLKEQDSSVWLRKGTAESRTASP